jgi:hypothetical protein
MPLYYLSFSGNPDNAGSKLHFLDFFLSDLLEDARTHGSYRMLIDEKRKEGVVGEYGSSRLLIWLLAWDLEVITNMPEVQASTSKPRSYRALKIVYQTLPDADENPMAKAWLAAPEKLDRLRYDGGVLDELVEELTRANGKLPEDKRRLHGFNVAVLRHG